MTVQKSIIWNRAGLKPKEYEDLQTVFRAWDARTNDKRFIVSYLGRNKFMLGFFPPAKEESILCLIGRYKEILAYLRGAVMARCNVIHI